MNKSEKAALFIFLTLIAAIVAGIAFYLRYADHNAVPLLAVSVLVAFFLIVATVRLALKLHTARAAQEYGVPPGRLLALFSARQWFSLLIGLTVIAIGLGSVTGVRVLASGTASAPTPTTVPTAVAPPPTAALPPVAATSGTATASPSDLTPSPTDSPTDAPTADASVSPVPQPNSTTYLDSARALDGGYDPTPVTFSSVRYPRGIALWCTSATSTYLQWNVAGYVRFHAVAGIDDGTQDAFGMTIELIFYDQDGRELSPKPVDASVGHPQEITLNLSGVVSLRMTCAGRQTKTNRVSSVRAALGDPVIVHG